MIPRLALLISLCIPALAQCPLNSPHCVLLSWSNSPSISVTGYKIYRSTKSGGPYSHIATNTPYGNTAYIDYTNLIEGDTYYYVVTAFTPSGESGYSNEATAKIPATISLPTSLTAFPRE
jgi:fibronectin type 3 domain-containing protein